MSFLIYHFDYKSLALYPSKPNLINNFPFRTKDNSLKEDSIIIYIPHESPSKPFKEIVQAEDLIRFLKLQYFKIFSLCYCKKRVHDIYERKAEAYKKSMVYNEKEFDRVIKSKSINGVNAHGFGGLRI